MKGFVVLPRRWVVERTFSWFSLKKPSYFIDRYKRCLDWYAKWITAKAAH